MARMVFAVILLFALAANLAAQDRMPPIPSDKMTDAQKDAAGAFRAERGQDVFGPFVPLLRSPELMTRSRALGDYLRFKSTLPPRLSEFVILVTARHWTQQYEWDFHTPIAIKAGVDPETIKAIAEGRRPDRLTDDERTLYDFLDELHRNKGVSDTTYARAVSRFGEQGTIDTLGITGYYTFLAMVLNTARTPLPAGVMPPLPTFPH